MRLVQIFFSFIFVALRLNADGKWVRGWLVDSPAAPFFVFDKANQRLLNAVYGKDELSEKQLGNGLRDQSQHWGVAQFGNGSSSVRPHNGEARLQLQPKRHWTER